MMCEFCGGQTSTRRLKKQHWLHGRLYIVENIEAEVCSECRERYFHAIVLDQIDALLENERQVKDHLYVEVVSL